MENVKEMIAKEMEDLLLKYKEKADYIEDKLLAFDNMEHYFRDQRMKIRFTIEDTEYVFEFLDKYSGQYTDSVYYPTIYIVEKGKACYGNVEEDVVKAYTLPSTHSTYDNNFNFYDMGMDAKRLNKAYEHLPQIVSIIANKIKEHMQQ